MKNKSWNKFWEEYKEPSNSEKWLIKERDKIIDTIKNEYFGKKKIKILEVGCGYASNSKILNKRKDYEVFCIDLSKKAILMTRKEIKNSFVMNAEELKFKDNYFDIVFSAGLLEHFKDPSKIVKEIIRVTKNNGLAITFVPGKYSLWQLWIRLHGKQWQHGYEEPYTQKKLNKIFNYDNIQIIEREGIDPFSLNGFLLKLFNVKTSFRKSFSNAYTEIYNIVKKV
jgi:ubiquinone/menaquinone biosynthesis C-methylase UbiE